jgi:predicted RNase H-like nuclease (RuvC/YqgF family)
MPPDILHQSEALTQARIDIAALERTVEGMGREIGELKTGMKELVATIHAMRDQLTEARGGWRVLMAIGGASATAGGVIAWAAEHLIGKTP